jgi:uncharacterized protein (DUF362 family)
MSKSREITRRSFLKAGAGIAAGLAVGPLTIEGVSGLLNEAKPVVGIAKIQDGKIAAAVEKAVDLLGGMAAVTKGKNRIMLKPNLVSENPAHTTKPEVIRALAQMMKRAGKEVLIGEGSAAATGFNVKEGQVYRTKNEKTLKSMQQFVFDRLGYTELAASLGVPLVNLHLGDMATVDVPGGFAFKQLTLHRSLRDIDLLCSVPMMKTHQLAVVTLGMKNLVGVFPGTVYYAVRGLMHDQASEVEPSGTACAVIDMVRANKLGLVVIDGSTAMEGNGPSNGTLVKMDVIVAGTNPLATDMVAADLMGFPTGDVPTFTWAHKAGMKPLSLEDIEIRGEKPDAVRRPFVKPNVVAWKLINKIWGAGIIDGPSGV